MLGEKPQYPFTFLNELKEVTLLESWLKKQNFSNFWYTSNKIMFLLYFLTYEQAKLDCNNCTYITYLLNQLDLLQDSTTGFWGTQNGASLLNGMFGAAHIYLYYNYYNKEIKYKKIILENVLKLKNSYGLFGSKLGGACEDYNGVEIVSTLLKNYEENFRTIADDFYRTHNIISKSQNKDGGFSYSINNRNIFEIVKDELQSRNYVYYYSDWNKMKSNIFKSDLWGTYFRVLTIAKIEKMLEINTGNEYRLYSLPGWGY